MNKIGHLVQDLEHFEATNTFYTPTKSEGYSFGVIHVSVLPFIPPIRPHILSVLNNISVPIGQIVCILGIND